MSAEGVSLPLNRVAGYRAPSLLVCTLVDSAGCKQGDAFTSIMLLINEHIAGLTAFRMNDVIDVCICVSIETIGTEVRGVA
jgi:hypothetical protein